MKKRLYQEDPVSKLIADLSALGLGAGAIQRAVWREEHVRISPSQVYRHAKIHNSQCSYYRSGDSDVSREIISIRLREFYKTYRSSKRGKKVS